MRSLKFHNLTNLYTKTNPSKITDDFKRILEQSRNGICGIEIKSNRGGTDFTLVSPSFLRQSGIIRSSTKNHISEDDVFLEGYLSEPFFLPLCTILDGEFIERIQSLSFILKDNESVFIQWLFKKASNYQEKAIEMYSSYILGNDYPLTFNTGRKFQEKVINLTGKLGVVAEVRDYIKEAEQKIVSEGYCFKLIVAIDCSLGRQDYIVNRLNDILNQYTYYNAIKLAEIKGKGLLQEIDDCTMTHDTKYQILSKREILSLFGGNDELDEVYEDEREVVEVGIREMGKFKGSGLIVKDAIELLPDYPMQLEQVNESEGMIQEVAEALKRVGIIKQARIYNASVVSGVRLLVIQFDTPKGVNLTDIMKKQKDIQGVLGIEELSIEQGDMKDTVKMLIPNENPAVVGLRGLMEIESFKEYSKKHELSFVAGVDEIGQPIFLNMVELVHLLIAGTSGSGKSSMIFSIAIQLMLMNSPEKLKLVMIDPKQIEFQYFSQFPHTEVITDMDKASSVLDSLTEEMESRYSTFLDAGVRRIDLYNQKILDPNSDLKAPLMEYIVVIIDEYADLHMTHPDTEDYIVRLGNKARSAGIHVILASQRPSSDIVNGKIKANFLNAISFNLGNATNYKTIFGTGIPYNLLGRGDGCFKVSFWHKDFQRFQSPIITINESEEEKLYSQLAEYLNKKYRNHKESDKEVIDTETNEDDNFESEDENLKKLKEIIATTKETRTVELRSKLKVKNTTLINLMSELVDQGWLKKDLNSRGYELIADEEELNKYRNPSN